MNAQPALALVGDIGGTNARFALTDLDRPQADLQHIHALRNADFASLQHAIEHYLAECGAQPRRAAIAVASPVNTDEIRLTNRAWSFSRREMQAALGLDELRMLNDFGAIAWSVPALQEHGEYEHLYGPEHAELQGPVSVIGAGTGLGVGLLVGSQAHGWHAVETEGGHASFAPLDSEEREIAAWMTAKYGRVSNERLLCGKGLSEIDAVLRGVPMRPSGSQLLPGESSLANEMREPADVVALALDGHDQAARRTLARFCAVFGAVCGDAVLMHGARTVVIAGGIVPRFIPFLRSSAFRERFLAKGRFTAMLESVHVQVATASQPGLLGAATALRASDL